jgi:hypothetical protein
MKEILVLFVRCVGIFAIFGILVGIASQFTLAYIDKSDKIAPGYNYIYISVSIFLLFAYFQWRNLKDDFADGIFSTSNKSVKIISYFSGILSLSVFVGLLLAFFDFFPPEKVSSIFPATPNRDSSFIVAVLDAMYHSGIVFGVTFASLVIIFRFGLFYGGLNLALAMHNFFNGRSFDLSVLYELYVEFNVSELLGAILTILQIGITCLLGKSIEASN